MLRRQLQTALRMTVALIVLLGLAYPLVVTGVAQALFKDNANGSLVKQDGRVVGSTLIGQNFADKNGNALPQYLQPRPSAAGAGYDAMASGGSQLGPSSQTLLDDVKQRTDAYRALNGLAPGTPVPVDAVTSSGSGLDPDISVANARLQAPRIAKARGVDVNVVTKVIADHTQTRQLGVLGEDNVNVLDVNLALDKLH
jgi:potassium-transporting ATPase KdpC subunit